MLVIVLTSCQLLPPNKVTPDATSQEIYVLTPSLNEDKEAPTNTIIDCQNGSEINTWKQKYIFQRGIVFNKIISSSNPCLLWLIGKNVPQEEVILANSQDGGQTLQTVYSFKENFPTILRLTDLLVEENVIWVIGISKKGEGVSLKSNDYGLSWQEITLSFTLNSITLIEKFNNKIFIGGSSQNSFLLLNSNNEGINWNKALEVISSHEEKPEISKLYHTDSNIYAIGTDGQNAKLWTSSKNGQNFDEIMFPVDFTSAVSIASFNHEIIYVGGYKKISSIQTESIFMVTTDSGKTWQQLNVPNENTVSDIFLTSPNTGYIMANGPYLFEKQGINNVVWEKMELVPKPSLNAPTSFVKTDEGILYAYNYHGGDIYQLKLTE